MSAQAWAVSSHQRPDLAICNYEAERPTYRHGKRRGLSGRTSQTPPFEVDDGGNELCNPQVSLFLFECSLCA